VSSSLLRRVFCFFLGFSLSLCLSVSLCEAQQKAKRFEAGSTLDILVWKKETTTRNFTNTHPYTED